MEPNQDVWPGRVCWVLRLLGRFDVASPDKVVPRFRSRTASAVLACLALHPDREVPRHQLHDAFWPDSDGDRQAQNLRRAVADIRSALEGESPRGSFLLTSPDGVTLSTDGIATDTRRFADLVEAGLAKDDPDSLRDAVRLYGGPVLAPMRGDWITGYQLEYEEQFAQAMERLAALLIAGGQVKEALRLGRTAVLAAPLREEIQIALINAYKACGMEAEAVRQFQEWERLLDEELGESPSEQAREALDAPRVAVVRPASAAVVALEERFEEHVNREAELLGGAVPLASPYYVERASDQRMHESLARRDSVILLHGPRQSGKTSLLARAMAEARDAERAVALADLQTLSHSQLESDDRLYRTLAHGLARQLGQTLDLDAVWSDWLGPNLNLDAAVQGMLEASARPVCWAFDEADRLFGRAYANDFFGLLRSWHNRRALSPEGPWEKLTLILTYATEAHLFITDLSQSPFNVGVRIELADFTLAEVTTLHSRYGSPLPPEDVGRLYALTSGHPYLTRRALNAVMVQGMSLDDLEERAAAPDGPFGDHLRRLLGVLSQDEAMLGEVSRLLAGQPTQHPLTLERLAAAGVLAPLRRGKPEFRLPAYRTYLGDALGCMTPGQGA